MVQVCNLRLNGCIRHNYTQALIILPAFRYLQEQEELPLLKKKQSHIAQALAEAANAFSTTLSPNSSIQQSQPGRDTSPAKLIDSRSKIPHPQMTVQQPQVLLPRLLRAARVNLAPPYTHSHVIICMCTCAR